MSIIMKVAYFLGALNRGGAETLILDICRKHRDVPYDFVCVYRREGNMSDAFKYTRAPIIQIPKKRGYLRYLLDIRRTLLCENVTLVHSQTPSNTLLLTVALCGTGIKIITSFHGHSFADAVWWKRKIVYAASEKIICVSECEKRYYEAKWRLPKENKLAVVYNGIDFTKFDSEKSMVESVKCKAESGGIRLCMVGNFVKGRSPLVIVKAINLLCEQGLTNFDFYFVGRKNEKEPWRYEECVKYCEDNNLTNVHFLGAREDVPELLKTMDGFVYSTKHDTFGIAVIEAMAIGLPVVVNDWDVMTEVCGETNDGIRYFRTDDVEGAAAQIEAMLANLEKSKQVAITNAVAVRNKYSIETHIQQIYRIYSEIDNRR